MEGKMYFVSVFVDGKNKEMFFASHLWELAAVKSKYVSCDIDIWELNEFRRLSDTEIRAHLRFAQTGRNPIENRSDYGDIENSGGEKKP